MTATIDAPTFEELYDVHWSLGIPKVVRKHDGYIAVLVSHGFGAGWYSWNKDFPACLFDPKVVEAVLEGQPLNDTMRDHLEQTYQEDDLNYLYVGGYADLRVHFLKPGAVFRIDEYDGNESLVTLDHDDIHIA